MTKSDLQLLPCPFCGRKPRLRTGKRFKSNSLYDHHKAGDWMMRPGVLCPTCKLERVFDSVDETIKWWNTRPERK